MTSLNSLYVKNRAEEEGMDLWGSYIIPPYFPRESILDASKTVSIVGGRGSGKTSLLRYLSYHSQFSNKREYIVKEDLKFIGLYYKPDVNFLSSLRESGFKSSWWAKAFEHIVSLYLIEDFIQALNKINNTSSRQSRFGELEQVKLNSISGYFEPGKSPSNLEELHGQIVESKQRFRVWTRNLDIDEVPITLFSDVELLKTIVNSVTDQLTYLDESSIAIFIDEYESLLEYQQETFNGFIKNGESPIIFHIASKPYGMRTRKTLTSEIIVEKADYRLITLEAKNDDQFELFAAELFFFRLYKHAVIDNKVLPINPEDLQDPNKIDFRLNDEQYRQKVISKAKQVFPKENINEIAKRVYNSRKAVVRKNIQTGLTLHQSNLKVEDFLFQENPEISIVCGALLNRKRLSPKEILKSANDYQNNNNDQFKNWIQTNLHGCIYQIYSSSQEKNNPLYAGFTAITTISKLNIRHALDLFHEILMKSNSSIDSDKLPQASINDQVTAIKLVSAKAVEETKSFSNVGTVLFNFLHAISSLLLVHHKRTSQSEPEITHFFIKSGEIDDELERLLNEAEKWSVIIKYKSTKVKEQAISGYEYQPHPIYAPYFGISYRKKRNTGLSSHDLKTLFLGTRDSKDLLLKQLEKKLDVLPDNDSADDFQLERQ